MGGFGGWLIYSDIAKEEAARAAFQHRLGSFDRLIAAAPGSILDADRFLHGKTVFETTCAACHKADGSGLEGLGKTLTRSWFVASLDDAELKEFLVRGRGLFDPLNTSKVAMPPKGGHDELTDADLSDVVTYVRGLQDSRRLPPLPASAFAATPVAPPTEEVKAKALAAAAGDAELAGFIAHGTKLFAATCSACHGPDAHGLKNLGKDLVASELCRKLDDDALLAFIKRGRNPGDPLNTTKVDMPAKGGNPALSDDDILDIISFVRSLQKQASAKQ
jgi:mono/diheme cytochrome c family protein